MWDERPAWLERHGKTITGTMCLVWVGAALAGLAIDNPIAGAVLYACSVLLTIIVLTIAANALVLTAFLVPARLLAHLFRRARRA